ncbi:Hypothetical predicted protein [Marmota monax]|uniref:Uncharacterized protein n=1 Tax=Marmota monax TaxID=9995 RepID=A0A5E4A4F4_MARMO|nr:hypothetical protein GHT09_002531 [Marmota monax]VTJ51998.1 Hypothetical predicted protein [Marmota monax]
MGPGLPWVEAGVHQDSSCCGQHRFGGGNISIISNPKKDIKDVSLEQVLNEAVLVGFRNVLWPTVFRTANTWASEIGKH